VRDRRRRSSFVQPGHQRRLHTGLAKQLNQLVPPVSLVISGSYTTPRTPGDNLGARVVSQIARDWQLGVLLRYQNGSLISAPSSSNQLINQLLRQGGFNGTPLNLDTALPA